MIDKDSKTISLTKAVNWDLSALEVMEVTTKLPDVVTSVADMPAELDISYGGKKDKAIVKWTLSDTKLFTVQTATANLGEAYGNRTITHQVAVAPAKMQYFVDAGAVDTAERTYYNLIKNSVKNNSSADQQYINEAGWGYLETNTKARSPQAGTESSIYEMLRYSDGKSDRSITYQFDGCLLYTSRCV